MASATFEQLLGTLAQTQLSVAEVAPLQDRLTAIHQPEACLALILPSSKRTLWAEAALTAAASGFTAAAMPAG